jgi:hypothetical protein
MERNPIDQPIIPCREPCRQRASPSRATASHRRGWAGSAKAPVELSQPSLAYTSQPRVPLALAVSQESRQARSPWTMGACGLGARLCRPSSAATGTVPSARRVHFCPVLPSSSTKRGVLIWIVGYCSLLQNLSLQMKTSPPVHIINR